MRFVHNRALCLFGYCFALKALKYVIVMLLRNTYFPLCLDICLLKLFLRVYKYAQLVYVHTWTASYTSYVFADGKNLNQSLDAQSDRGRGARHLPRLQVLQQACSK